MLTYLLAFAVALASIGLYAMTFFLPAFKREQDLIWSGVGLFYALVLWVCAGQVRGGLLLGQMASVGLIGWLGWQAFGARWAGLSAEEKAQVQVLTDIQSKFSSVDFSKLDLGKLGNQAKGLADKAKSSAQSIANKAQDVTESVKDSSTKAGNVMDSIKTVADNVVDKATDAKATIVDTVSKGADKVADSAAVDKVADRVEEVADQVADLAETAAAVVDDAADQA